MKRRFYGLVTYEGTRTLVEFPEAPGCQTFAEAGESIEQLGREALEGWLAAGGEPVAEKHDWGEWPEIAEGGRIMVIEVEIGE